MPNPRSVRVCLRTLGRVVLVLRVKVTGAVGGDSEANAGPRPPLWEGTLFFVAHARVLVYTAPAKPTLPRTRNHPSVPLPLCPLLNAARPPIPHFFSLPLPLFSLRNFQPALRVMMPRHTARPLPRVTRTGGSWASRHHEPREAEWRVEPHRESEQNERLPCASALISEW